MVTVLVLCTGNSARSILGEALFNAMGGKNIKAYSAGSHPKEAPHPAALALLQEQGISTKGLSSKSWNTFVGKSAPQIDIVITVCDSAAGETCPLFPGWPMRVHWGLEDPAACTGSDAEIAAAFRKTFEQLRKRIKAFQALDIETIPTGSLKQRLDEIGQMEG